MKMINIFSIKLYNYWGINNQIQIHKINCNVGVNLEIGESFYNHKGLGNDSIFNTTILFI